MLILWAMHPQSMSVAFLACLANETWGSFYMYIAKHLACNLLSSFSLLISILVHLNNACGAVKMQQQPKLACSLTTMPTRPQVDSVDHTWTKTPNHNNIININEINIATPRKAKPRVSSSREKKTEEQAQAAALHEWITYSPSLLANNV